MQIDIFYLANFGSGRDVMSIYVTGVSLRVDLDLSQLSNGIYFCRLEGSGSVQKLVNLKCNYLPCVLVLTKFLVITAKNAKVDAKLAKTWCSWRKILPIPCKYAMNLQGEKYPK